MGFKHSSPGECNWQEAVFGKFCFWRAIDLTATWRVRNTRISVDISKQIIIIQSGKIKGCSPEIVCLKITTTAKDHNKQCLLAFSVQTIIILV